MMLDWSHKWILAHVSRSSPEFPAWKFLLNQSVQKESVCPKGFVQHPAKRRPNKGWFFSWEDSSSSTMRNVRFRLCVASWWAAKRGCCFLESKEQCREYRIRHSTEARSEAELFPVETSVLFPSTQTLRESSTKKNRQNRIFLNEHVLTSALQGLWSLDLEDIILALSSWPRYLVSFWASNWEGQVFFSILFQAKRTTFTFSTPSFWSVGSILPQKRLSLFGQIGKKCRFIEGCPKGKRQSVNFWM